MIRVLLTGANGQLGRDVVRAGENIDLVGFRRAELDVTNRAQTLAKVKDVRPDVIIHAAAYTAVDDCESAEQLAYDVNAAGTANVVAAAAQNASRLIYISTDYVFDGTKPTPYVESDQPNPASVYGASKLAGETAVRELGEKGLIVRTSWVCGAHGSNMVKTILRAADNHPVLTFVDDQIGKPTFTADLAPVLLTLAQREETRAQRPHPQPLSRLRERGVLCRKPARARAAWPAPAPAAARPCRPTPR